MSRWKNPMVIRVERGITEKYNIFVLLERVNSDNRNYYREVEKFTSMDKALKKNVKSWIDTSKPTRIR